MSNVEREQDLMRKIMTSMEKRFSPEEARAAFFGKTMAVFSPYERELYREWAPLMYANEQEATKAS